MLIYFLYSVKALETIFASAAERAISINECSANVKESEDKSFEEAKDFEVLSLTTPKPNQSAKSITKTAKCVEHNIAFSSEAISSDCNESEKLDNKGFEENSDSKTSNESFDSNWELEKDTVKVGKEQFFLSLASHNGKLLSFSDNDRRHDNLDHVTEQERGIIKGEKVSKLL